MDTARWAWPGALNKLEVEHGKKCAIFAGREMKLYHATTQKKAKLYRQSGVIHAPVWFTPPNVRVQPATPATEV